MVKAEIKSEVLIQPLIPWNSKAVSSLAEETVIHSLRQLFREGFSFFCQKAERMWVYTPQCCVTMAPLILPSPQHLKLQPERHRAAVTPPNDRPSITNQNNDCSSRRPAGMPSDWFARPAFMFLMELLEKWPVSRWWRFPAPAMQSRSQRFQALPHRSQEEAEQRAAPGATSFSDTRIRDPGAQEAEAKHMMAAGSETGLPLKSLWAEIGRKWRKH